MTTLESGQSSDGALFIEADLGEPTALCASKCHSCERVSFPQRALCPACGAETSAIQLSGPARLRVHTGVLAQPPGSLVTAPYDVGVAEYAEGICIIGLVDGPAQRGDEVSPVIVEPYPTGRMFAFRRTSNGK